ncbi:hypothetical protein N0V86_001595 [Didymella sp. IMI 355093]|nr:hypothetical protein N0V86_001595 [Didymella sp. IMI 355093]
MSQSQLHQARGIRVCPGRPDVSALTASAYCGVGAVPYQQADVRGAAQLQQQQQQQQHNPYSSAPYSQTLPSPAHQQFAQNRQTASPALSNQGQPYATPQPQQSPTTLPSSNGQQQPMNLNLPSQVKSEPAQAQTPVKAVPPSPVSPVTPAKAHERVAVLLEINSILITEATTLQSQGKGGQIAAPEEGKPQPSKEYIDYIRRLQANLSYLAQNAEKVPKPGQPIQPGPAIMSAPATHEELGKLYVKLQGLFPGWKGGQPTARQSPGGPQRMNSNTSQPPNSAGLQQNWGQNPMQMQQQQQQQPKMEPLQ